MTASATDVRTVFDNTGGPSARELQRFPESTLPWPIGNDILGGYPEEDPRRKLAKRLEIPGPNGWVMVQASEIRDLYMMTVCRSTHVFDRDEDGTMPEWTAHCILTAEHDRRHTNGYFGWEGPAVFGVQYLGDFQADDPRTALWARLQHFGPEGWVLVKAAEIKAVFGITICRSSHGPYEAEGGPGQYMRAHCVLSAPHTVDHTDGPHTWEAKLVPSER